jgi:hypothetical protein
MSDVHLEALPRMADFVLWATACETALWPAGTFARSYKANRRATVESIIEADPIANCVRAIMVDRTMWTGSASDLLHLWAESARDEFRGAQHGQKKTAGARRPTAASADANLQGRDRRSRQSSAGLLGLVLRGGAACSAGSEDGEVA